MSDSTPRDDRALVRIASLLGLSVEHFHDPGVLSRWDRFAEGVQLLQRIDRQDRMGCALECLRAIVRAEAERDVGERRS